VLYSEVVKNLEALQIMPKTMPGLEKIKKALVQTDWFASLDANKIIVVAGTNGKGSTCAALEALLLDAGQSVGFYSSPHLVSTVERIRVNGKSISEERFIELYQNCEILIKSCELSHFEALTLMMGDYFFNSKWGQQLDYAILEVGLGGLFDATNAFPHKFNVITKLGLDHMNILGTNLSDIAKNKFGIVGKKSIVVHQPLQPELHDLKMQYQKETNSNWVEIPKVHWEIKKISPNSQEPKYIVHYEQEKFEINLIGERAVENIITAITAFEVLGFLPTGHTKALNNINWQGRMQKSAWPSIKCPVYLSGDHNQQGVESLIKILKDFNFQNLHLVVGIGVDKDAETMLNSLISLNNAKIYLTETPFKGRKVSDYPSSVIAKSVYQSHDLKTVLEKVSNVATENDLCVITGSLYLVGQFLSYKATSN
jgi:dihydrofolate synthase/folylpolyglutamate synthase